MNKSINRFGFWKTTIIGGLLFLLPLIVLGALVGQIIPIVLVVAEALYDVVPLKTPAGIAVLILLAILILLLLCFVAGLLARRSFARRISRYFEKNITTLFPRYTIIKEQMKGSLGGAELRPNMNPVLVHFDDCTRIGFEMERAADQRVTVYLPGAPDAWSGFVVYVKPDRVEPLPLEFNDVVGISEQLGRESAGRLTGHAAGPSTQTG